MIASTTTSLTGKTAVVTGASSGIGHAIASRLLAAGAGVIGLCRSTGKVPEGVRAIACDLADSAQIEAAFSTLADTGTVDIFINNAGLALLSGITDGDPADWEEMWRVNVHGLALCCQRVLPLLPASGGQIINVSSMSGLRVPGTGGFYSPTKFAVRAVTDALRNELRRAGSVTRVATISPGYVDTPILDRYFAGREDKLAETRAAIRMLTPDDIATSVLHILTTPLHVEITDVQMRSADQKG